MKTSAKELVIVELADNTFATAEAENGKLVRTEPRKVTQYTNGQTMAPDVARRLSGSHIALVDAGVKVSPGDIKRIVGPVDCDEAIRIRVRKATANWWPNNAFVETAPLDALRAALAKSTYSDFADALSPLRK